MMPTFLSPWSNDSRLGVFADKLACEDLASAPSSCLNPGAPPYASWKQLGAWGPGGLPWGSDGSMSMTIWLESWDHWLKQSLAV